MYRVFDMKLYNPLPNQRMRRIVVYGIVYVSLLCFGLCCITSNNKYKINNENTKTVDSLRVVVDSLIRLNIEVEDMIEECYRNKCYRLSNQNTIAADGSIHTFRSFSSSTIYVYVTPLTCWSCMKTISAQLKESPYYQDVVFLLAGDFSIENKSFLEFAEIPIERTYALVQALQIPIEDKHSIFLFNINKQCEIHNIEVI